MTKASTDGTDNLNAAERSEAVADCHEVGEQAERSRAKPTDPPAVSLELFCAQDKRSPNKLSSRKIFFDERKLLDEKNELSSRGRGVRPETNGAGKAVILITDTKPETLETDSDKSTQHSATAEITTNLEIRDIASGMLSQD